MLDAGIAVGLGSDSMAANNRMHLLEESRAAALAQRVRATRHDALLGEFYATYPPHGASGHRSASR